MSTKWFKGSILILGLILGLAWTAAAQNGIIKGIVLDGKNNEPIPFADVVIENSTAGTSTDLDGTYELSGLEPGLYNVVVSFLGYKTVTEFEIQVSNSKPAIRDFSLLEDAEIVEEVVVKSSPFTKTEESPVSLQTIGTAEIQRNPGGNRDISRVIRILPGVTTTANFRNDLLIRGGAPNENRFYLDDVEVPNINHFATQGASGGPNGLINVDFIREVDFYSGAFPANRGNTLSSVFQFKQKNGRDDRIGFTGTLGTSDLALTMEGPLDKKGRTTFLLSARQSYLQLLFQLIELPFLPTYNDFQFKVRTRIGEKNEFYVLGLGAVDRFKLNLNANETPEQRYLLDNLPVNNQWNYTLGAVYKRFTDNGYWTFVLSRNMLNNDIFKYVNNDETQEKFIDYTSQEAENKFRVENTSRFNGFKLVYGLGYQFVRYTNSSKDYQFVNGTLTPFDYESKFNFHRYSAFGQLSKKFLKDRIVVSAGVRLDGNSYSSEMANPLKQVSPRLSLSFALTERLTFNVNSGMYYQLPAYTSMGYQENDVFINKDRLKYIRNIHVIAGMEYMTKTNTKFSVEGYYKLYNNYPFLLNEQIALANQGGDFGVIGNAPVSSISEGRTYGLELLVQQRIYKGFYGILAYTLGWSEFKDANGLYVPTSWDSRHIINMALGKSFNAMNTEKRQAQNARRVANGKEEITRKMIPQTLELGLNVRFQTGLPYTPFDYEASALVSNWNVRGQAIPNFDLLNTSRANLAYGIDFRVDYKWFFDKWSFNLYLDLQNIPGAVSGVPQLILEQGDSGNETATILNAGQPNESYLLREIVPGASTITPTLGIIVQY